MSYISVSQILVIDVFHLLVIFCLLHFSESAIRQFNPGIEKGPSNGPKSMDYGIENLHFQ